MLDISIALIIHLEPKNTIPFFATSIHFSQQLLRKYYFNVSYLLAARNCIILILSGILFQIKIAKLVFEEISGSDCMCKHLPPAKKMQTTFAIYLQKTFWRAWNLLFYSPLLNWTQKVLYLKMLLSEIKRLENAQSALQTPLR